MNTLINGISNILTEAIFTIVGLATTYLIAQVSLYLGKKKQVETVKLGADTYNSRATVAKGIFYQVEQLFKLIPNAGNLKATMFDKILLAKFPFLTQSQLDHFRESVVGEVNNQVETLLAPVYDPVKDEADVVVTKEVSSNTQDALKANETPQTVSAQVGENKLTL
ncbi:MAG TPA: hypothetical protein VIK72_19635 [Clostridiaceae bacterium]